MLAEYSNIICTQHPIIILLSECCSQKVGGVDAYGGLRLEVLPGLTPSGSRWSRGTAPTLRLARQCRWIDPVAGVLTQTASEEGWRGRRSERGKRRVKRGSR